MSGIDIRSVETLIKVKFLKRGDKIFQYFMFDKDRNTELMRDSRFSVYNKFERKLKEFSLETMYPSNFSFIERIDAEDKITLVFSVVEDREVDNYYFIVAGFVPKTPGCLFCEYNSNHETNFIQCSLKGKTLTKFLKSCSVFKEMPGLFKT